MQVLNIEHEQSWVGASSPLVLSKIVSPKISVAIWNRTSNDVIQQYFRAVFNALGMGVKGVYPISEMEALLTASLPDGAGKEEVAKDIFLLADMLTCLFDCNEVGLRLVPLKSAMCPKFHTDNIPVRLVHTYLGSGTEWLPSETLYKYPPQSLNGRMSRTNFGMYYQPNNIKQLNAFDVALLKGSAWQGHEHMAAAHRSCQLAQDEKRVLLTLDPM